MYVYTRKELRMNSPKPILPLLHAAAGLKRLLIAVLAVFLLGALTAISALASSGTWTLTGNMNLYRDSFTATLLTNGQVLVAGGDVNGYPVATNVAELYNPSTGKWTDTKGP
jgi:hypothetical protein